MDEHAGQEGTPPPAEAAPVPADAARQGSDSPQEAAGRPDQRSATGSQATDDTVSSGFDDSNLGEAKDGFGAIQQQVRVGTMQAENVIFGGGPPPRSRQTGGLTADEVAAQLHGFVDGPAFGGLAVTLERDRLLVLTGPEGSGRRMAALALLARRLGPTAELVTLSPALTLAELAEHDFRAGRGYLLVDHMHDSRDADSRHALQSLQARLVRSGATLVVTTESGKLSAGLRASWIARWTPPEPEELWAQWCALLPDDAEVPDCDHDHFEDLRGYPAELRLLFEDTISGPDGARASARARVERWFSAERSARDVARLAAAAFATPCSARQLERRVEDLRRFMLRPEEEIDPAVADWDAALPQERARGRDDLLCHLRDNEGTRLWFLGKEQHETVCAVVLAELHRRYGSRLWDGLDQWLDVVAREGSVEERVQLARGIALLSRAAPEEVERRYLQRWSVGLVAERLAAAFCLAWMSYDQRGAKDAMQIVLGWAERGRPRQAATAALALGTHLGTVFPEDTVRWLWFLASREQGVSPVARASLSMLAREVAEGDDIEALEVLLTLLRRVARSTTRGDGWARFEGAQAAAALLSTGTAVAPLIAGDDDELLAPVLLEQASAAPGALAALWVLALSVGSTRMVAVRALRRTLTALQEVDSVSSAVQDLQDRIALGLTPDQLRRLDRDLGGLWPSRPRPPLALSTGNPS